MKLVFISFVFLIILNICVAFHNFTDGAEHKFLMTIEETVSGTDRDYNRTLDGYLHITEHPIGWLSCLITGIRQDGFPYYEEFYEIFYVKVRNDTLESLMGKGISTEIGLKIKRELIQELIKDRSDLKQFLHHEHDDAHLRVQLPMGACKPEISKVPKFLQKDLIFRSNAADCDLRGVWMENKSSLGITKLSDGSFNSVRLRFQSITNFQAELEVYFKIISMPDSSGRQKSLIKRMKYEYLGSRTTNRYVQNRAETIQL